MQILHISALLAFKNKNLGTSIVRNVIGKRKEFEVIIRILKKYILSYRSLRLERPKLRRLERPRLRLKRRCEGSQVVGSQMTRKTRFDRP